MSTVKTVAFKTVDHARTLSNVFSCQNLEDQEDPDDLDVRIDPLFALPTTTTTEELPGEADRREQARIARCRDEPSQFGFCVNQVKDAFVSIRLASTLKAWITVYCILNMLQALN